MKFRLMIGTLVAALLCAGAAPAAIDSGQEFLQIVQQRVDRGELSVEDALLLKFQYAFDRDKLPQDLQPQGKAPLKCGTSLVREYLDLRDRLASDVIATIETYLAPPAGEARLSHFSPSGLFRINYATTGGDAVPGEDADGNYVPDFVERVAEYLDYSLDFECNQLGFETPPFQADAAYMSIYLADLDGVYGFTQPLSYPPGMTRITMDNDFIGYPPNDDPDGNALGAAKVTAAHEFKHSTQYAGSRWSEDGWVEVDATWMEEIAYPETNDYLNYLSFGSPIADPDIALDGGSTGTGSYEDCVWQHYQSQRFGNQFVVDLWDHRKSNTSEEMIDSYEAVLLDYGMDLVTAWTEFTTWNFATGVRDLTDDGYAEAEIYPTGSAQRTVYSYPSTYNGSVTRLAANFIRCLYVDEPGKRIQVTLDGSDDARMTLGVVVNESYATNAGTMYFVDLDANNDAVYEVPYDLEGVYSVGIVVGNANKTGVNRSYSLQIEKVDATTTAASDVAAALAITGNHPNPFNPSTAIAFALGGTAATQLDIYDLSGRKVRTLVDATLDAGQHTVRWNGQDDAGRPLASGTYVARLRSGGQVTSHKLVLAK
jgi:hypothetical protein